MIQSPNDLFDSLEEKMDHIQNLKNSMIEPILRISNNIALSNQLNRNQESWCLEGLDQDSISSHQLELDHPNLWTKWQVLTSMKLNLIVNVNPILNFVI